MLIIHLVNLWRVRLSRQFQLMWHIFSLNQVVGLFEILVKVMEVTKLRGLDDELLSFLESHWLLTRLRLVLRFILSRLNLVLFSLLGRLPLTSASAGSLGVIIMVTVLPLIMDMTMVSRGVGVTLLRLLVQNHRILIKLLLIIDPWLTVTSSLTLVVHRSVTSALVSLIGSRLTIMLSLSTASIAPELLLLVASLMRGVLLLIKVIVVDPLILIVRPKIIMMVPWRHCNPVENFSSGLTIVLLVLISMVVGRLITLVDGRSGPLTSSLALEWLS